METKMETETFTKTFTGTIVEVTYQKSVIHPDGDPVELRLRVPGGIGIGSISEECVLRNAHKLADLETVFYMKL